VTIKAEVMRFGAEYLELESRQNVSGISYTLGMCGYYGVFLHQESSLREANVFDLSKSVSHRGPDGHLQIENSHAKVVHHRLKITGGMKNQQPIKSGNGDIFVFNGEIYNTRELIARWSLSADAADDAQVFAEIWRRFGKKHLTEIDGVFSGAFISVSEKKMYLFRDRFGARPIYYRQNSAGIHFASEVHPLIEAANSNSLNLEAIYDFIILNMPLNSETHIKDVFEVPPATVVTFDMNSSKMIKSSDRYWSYEWTDAPHAGDNVFEDLREAVSSQVPKDVDYSSYLSSGIDSSLITYFLSQHNPELKTFTLTFDGTSDEFSRALETAKFLSVKSHGVVFNEAYSMSRLDKVLTAIQVPRIGQSIVNYCVHEEAARDSKVVFSGAGADELFGGYPWRYPLKSDNGQISSMELTYSDTLSWIQQKWNKLGDVKTLQRLMPGQNLEEILENRLARLELSLPSSLFEKSDPWSPVKLAMRFDQHNFLPHLLTVDDALSMQFGLEVRVPYLSNQMISLASRVPIENLFSIDKQGGDVLGKAPLRQVAHSIFGDRVAFASKKGFSAPGSTWAIPVGKSLLAKEETIWGFIDRKYFTEILENKAGHHDRQISSIVWTVSNLVHHFNQFAH
jgi:asparagine synthase (glutamine-hydrolysing)